MYLKHKLSHLQYFVAGNLSLALAVFKDDPKRGPSVDELVAVVLDDGTVTVVPGPVST